MPLRGASRDAELGDGEALTGFQECEQERENVMWRRQLLQRVALAAPLVSSVAAGPANAAGERDPASLDQVLQPSCLPSFRFSDVLGRGFRGRLGVCGRAQAGLPDV